MVTMRDIARKAGVSTTTVSRVLNHTADEIGIAETTQQAIRKIARDMGYQPNRAARNLRMGRSPYAVLFLVPDTTPPSQGRTAGEGFLAHPFFAELVQDLQQEVQEGGGYLAFAPARADNMVAIQELLHHSIHGVITWGTLTPKWWQILATSSLPVAGLEPYSLPVVTEHEGIPTVPQLHKVFVNNSGAVIGAVDHLREQDYRRIVFVDVRRTDGHQHPAFRERVVAFQQYAQNLEECDRMGTVSVPSQAADIDLGPDILRALRQEELECRGCRTIVGEQNPMAIITPNDLAAIGVLRTAQEQGLAVPDSLGVVGIDDISWSRYQVPPLTSARIDRRAMASAAVGYILHCLEGQNPTAGEVRVPAILQARASSLRKDV